MLKLESMSCGYGQMRAVDGLTMEVPKGSLSVVIGTNGAGKSSTIMAIAGHTEIQGGRIFLDSVDCTNFTPEQRVHAGIALVPEGRRVFSDLTIQENLIIGGYALPKIRTKKNESRVFSLFPRLTERLRQPAGTLSGGEQQMLAIGRALMTEPRLLLIDEVSLGLMPKMVDICYDAINNLKQEGLTVLLVEQNTTRALGAADQVLVLESGRAAWEGTGSEARANPGLIDSYLGMEAKTALEPRP